MTSDNYIGIKLLASQRSTLICPHHASLGSNRLRMSLRKVRSTRQPYYSPIEKVHKKSIIIHWNTVPNHAHPAFGSACRDSGHSCQTPKKPLNEFELNLVCIVFRCRSPSSNGQTQPEPAKEKSRSTVCS
eukprot:1193177-Prorocentrum_minimum.AAC.1